MEFNIFATWLEFRHEARGMSRVDCVDEINLRLGEDCNRETVRRWAVAETAVPSAVLKMVLEDLPALLAWEFKRKEWGNPNINFFELAQRISPPIVLEKSTLDESLPKA